MDIEVDVESIYHEEAQRILKKERTREVDEMLVRQEGWNRLVGVGYKPGEIENIVKALYGQNNNNSNNNNSDYIGDPKNEDHIRWWLACASAASHSDLLSSPAAQRASLCAKILTAKAEVEKKEERVVRLEKFVEGLRAGGRKGGS